MTTIPEIIIHYQRSIEKSAEDRTRLLHCISKLVKLPITVQHLQETHIGRTVNALRKDDGEVGNAAKALVAKWKAMVAAEESSDGGENANGDHQQAADDENGSHETSSRNNNRSDHEEENRKEHRKNRDRSEDTLSKHSDRSSRKENGDHSSKHSSSKDRHSSSSSHSKEHIHRSDRISGDSSHHKSSSSKHRSSEDRKSHHNSHKSSSSAAAASTTNYSNNDESDGDDDDFDEQENKLVIDIKKEPVQDVIKSDNHRDKSHRNKSSSSRSGAGSSSHNSHSGSKDHHHKSSKSEHRSHSGQDSKHHSSSSSSSKAEESKHHHKSSSKNEKPLSNNKDNNHKSHRHSSSHSKDSESKQSEEDKHHKSSRSVEEGSSEDKNRPSRSHRDDKKDDGSSSSKRKHESISPVDAKRSSKSSKHGSSPKKVKIVESTVDSIDSSMGTSFADALGMIMPSSSKSTLTKSSSKTKISPKSSSLAIASTSAAPKATTSTPKSSKFAVPVKPEPMKIEKLKNTTPSLLTSNVKLEPLESVVPVAELPTISNNYRPMPLNPIVMDCVFKNGGQQPKKFMTDEEAFGSSTSSKNLRTKVYSGVKTGAIIQIPSLLELCLRTLKKNIDALEYTGGVPFDILKPVLECASPEQLATFEMFNPYLMEDNDILWESHCNRRFKKEPRLEYETWRELFLRCTEEREAKLSSLTENIKNSQTIAVPMKKTKLAYVNSFVKPPRAIQKKQNQYGTERKLSATPASRVASLSTVSTNVAKAGDTRLKVLAGIRDAAQVGSNNSSAKFGPKKAPLMMKTIQSIRQRFKR